MCLFLLSVLIVVVFVMGGFLLLGLGNVYGGGDEWVRDFWFF